MSEIIAKKDWLPEFRGKTFLSVRPRRNGDDVTNIVDIIMRSGEHFVLSVIDEVYFEGCMLNTLRRAQPITGVLMYRDDNTWTVEIETVVFPLLMLSAKVVGDNHSEFPFKLERLS